MRLVRVIWRTLLTPMGSAVVFFVGCLVGIVAFAAWFVSQNNVAWSVFCILAIPLALWCAGVGVREFVRVVRDEYRREKQERAR